LVRVYPAAVSKNGSGRRIKTGHLVFGVGKKSSGFFDWFVFFSFEREFILQLADNRAKISAGLVAAFQFFNF